MLIEGQVEAQRLGDEEATLWYVPVLYNVVACGDPMTPVHQWPALFDLYEEQPSPGQGSPQVVVAAEKAQLQLFMVVAADAESSPPWAGEPAYQGRVDIGGMIRVSIAAGGAADPIASPAVDQDRAHRALERVRRDRDRSAARQDPVGGHD